MPRKSAQQDSSPRTFDGSRKFVSRREAAEMLGRSIATVIRMERKKILTPKKLTGGERAMVAIPVAQITALIEAQG